MILHIALFTRKVYEVLDSLNVKYCIFAENDENKKRVGDRIIRKRKKKTKQKRYEQFRTI